MPVYIGNIAHDVYKGNVLQDVYSGNVLITGGGGNPAGTTLAFGDFTVEYEITSAGFVSLSATVSSTGEQALIDTTATDYPAGHTFAEVGSDTPRPNNIGIIVPVGYANEGVTVPGSVTTDQPAIDEPIIVTNAAEDVTQSSATLSGTITSTGDTAIDTYGFYIRQGTFTTHAEVRLGSKITPSELDEENTFTGSATISSSTTFTYYAYGINLTPLTGTGDLVTLTGAAPPAVQAEADYEFYNIDAPTGGTFLSSSYGDYGDWEGGTDILPNDTSPTSARCGDIEDECTLTRTRTRTDIYTGATQKRGLICSITVEGAGTPRCTNADGTTSPLGTTLSAASTTTRRLVEVADPEIIDVDNDAQGDPLDPYAKGNVTVSSCRVAYDGEAVIMLDYGTASNIVDAAANTSTTDTKEVTITFDASGTVPAGYSDTGETFGGEEVSQFNGLTTECTQDAAPELAPAFTTGPTVAAVAGTGTVTDGTDIDDDATVIVPTGVTSYFLSQPSGEGGIVTGAGGLPPPGGIKSISRNSSVTYTWVIPKNDTGAEVDYKITVRQF